MNNWETMLEEVAALKRRTDYLEQEVNFKCEKTMSD